MAGVMKDSLMGVKHPYYPEELNLPGYVPPLLPFTVVLAVFFSSSILLFLASWTLSGRQKHLHTIDRSIFCWFAVTGTIHFVVEGAVVVFPDFYKSESSNILFEIWKEYCQADSRYATRDAFTICMEVITAFIEGPLCFVILYGMLKQRSWRFTLQFAVSLGQLYGDVLYFATSYYDGAVYSRPEPLYFWFYFNIVNAVWIIVPGLVMWYSASHINRRVAHADLPKKFQ
ncbi:hypothetical protein WJX79_005541 [Trebouxia sp. C0005]|nr:MAG: C-8,7 sterol isomerase [Trebouxia sp. A1-2]KAA6425779.1 MAG: C-8,7 sterol isomerase [Trebouxia sp. A1-2]